MKISKLFFFKKRKESICKIRKRLVALAQTEIEQNDRIKKLMIPIDLTNSGL